MSLQKVTGIGPKVEELLVENGITDLTALAVKTPEELKAILMAKGGLMAQKDPSAWPAAAKALLEASPTDTAVEQAQPGPEPEASAKELTEEEALQAKIDHSNKLASDSFAAKKEAEEAALVLGNGKMKAQQAEGGKALFIERHLPNVSSQVRSLDAQRVVGTKTDLIALVVFQDTSSLEGKTPLAPEELADVLTKYIQEEIGDRTVVIGTSMKATKAAGQNPSDVEAVVRNVVKNSMAVTRSRMSQITKEYKVVGGLNFDGYMPVIE